jgi:Mg2+ and Co2+ transporter CorA
MSDAYARQMEPLNKVFASVAGDYAMLHEVEGATAAPLSLVVAFSDQLPMLMELKDDISAVSSDVQGVRDSISNLKNLLASLQDEYMNRTLFILTLVTAFCTPFAVMTGYYGMNFDFDEIDGGNGVGAFWIPMAVMVFLMLVAFWRGGFFRMLM